MTSTWIAALLRVRPTTTLSRRLSFANYRHPRPTSTHNHTLSCTMSITTTTHPSQPDHPPLRDHTPTPTTEVFDIVTPDGHPTGHTKPRSQVHADGDWHCSVHIWVVHIERPNEVLIQLRAKCKDSWPGYWDVGCAGHLSAGEGSEVAAKAEIGEELGIAVDGDIVNDTSNAQQGRLIHIDRLRQEVISQQGRFIDREWIDIYLLVGHYECSQMKLQVEEVEAVRYIDMDEYVALLEAGEVGYVPFANLTEYKRRVFDVIKQRLRGLSDGRTSQ